MSQLFYRGVMAPSNINPDFIKLLTQFKTAAKFISFKNRIEVSPDSFIYEIETTEGIFYVFEIDFIENLNDIKSVLINNIGEFSDFIEVKNIEKFDETLPYKLANTYQTPNDLEEIMKFANSKYGTADYYFNFLVKAKE